MPPPGSVIVSLDGKGKDIIGNAFTQTRFSSPVNNGRVNLNHSPKTQRGADFAPIWRTRARRNALALLACALHAALVNA
jgi:hypothetical protein